MSTPESTLSTARFRVYFLWFRHRSFYRILSLNISREVCDYLGFDCTVIPVICQNTLRLYNVRTRKVTVKEVGVTATMATMFCVTTRSSVLCIGGLPPTDIVYELCAPLFRAELISVMKTARQWPGVYCSHRAVYVFGGNIPHISSCEKMLLSSNQWSALADMSVARYSFTPCCYRNELYLVDATASLKSFEVFTLQTEVFRQLVITLPSSMTNNSITLEVNHELLVLFDSGRIARWLVETEEPIVDEMLEMHGLRAYSPSPPVAFEGYFYFCNYEKGELVRFDAEARSLSRVDSFTEVVETR